EAAKLKEEEEKAAREAEEKARKEAEKQAKEAEKEARKEAERQAKEGSKGPQTATAQAAETKAKEPKEPKAPKKWIFVTVPIEEGPQYKVGTVSVEGNKVFSESEILARVPLKPGGVFNDSIIKQGLGKIQLDYGEKGYFYVTANQVVDRQPDHTANLRI